MWLFPFNEYTVLFLILAVGFAAILLIRRFPGYKPTGKKTPRARREPELGPMHHHREDPHAHDHHV